MNKTKINEQNKNKQNKTKINKINKIKRQRVISVELKSMLLHNIQLIHQIMGSFRSQPDLQKHTDLNQGIGLSYVSTHMCGWRIYMQDAHLSISPLSDKKNSLFAVFDGHGGAEVSKYVERHFVKELQSNPHYKKGNYQVALKQTFMRMDEFIFSQAGRQQIVSIQKQMRQIQNGPKYQEQSHAGCTANVVLITPDFIYCANAGDSRSVACVKGQHQQLSKDHKPEDPQQLNRITKAGGTVSFGRVNGGLNLSRALGDGQYKKNDSLSPQEQMITAKPDIIRIKNQNIDFIIMGCDGIWQIKTNSQMVQWIKARLDRKDFKLICQQLLDELVSKDSGNQYGMDNMSAILIRFAKK